MTKLRDCAIADAESDYASLARSDEQWLRYVSAVRVADLGTWRPSTLAMVAVDAQESRIRAAWGEPSAPMHDLFSAYDSAYLAAIEVLVRRSSDGRSS
jgi:hypothetical protein